VTDAQGKAVAAALVCALDSSSSVSSAETDVRGNAELRIPADANLPWIAAIKPGVGFDYFENYQAWPPGAATPAPPREVTLVLEGARTVRVHTLDSAGNPVPGVKMVPWYIRKKGRMAYCNLSGADLLNHFPAHADGDGVVTFNWIPHEPGGKVPFLLMSEDYHLPDAPHYDPSRPQAKLTARISRNVPVGGSVTLPNGKPAAGILIQAEGRGDTNYYCRLLARTAADGRYRLKLYPDQSYIVAVTDNDWAAPSYTGLALREGDERKNLDFRLTKGTLIQGKVVVGPKAKPMPDQTVTIVQQGKSIPAELGGKWSKREDLVRWATTDQRGRYACRVGPGTYRISGPGPEVKEVVARGQEAIRKDFRIPRLPRGMLRGVVLQGGPKGKPVPGAIVKGRSIGKPGHAGFKCVADDQGCFQAERWRDQMWLYVCSPERALAGLVLINERTSDVKVMAAPSATVKGRIVSRDGGPLPGIRVACVLGLGHGTESVECGLNGKTDGKGGFAIRGLVVGEQCLLYAYSTGGERKYMQPKRLVASKAGETDLGDLVFPSDAPE